MTENGNLHLPDAQIRFLFRPERPLTEAELDQLDHIASCPQCQEIAQGTPASKRLDAALAYEMLAPHLSYGDICAYIEETLDAAKQRLLQRHVDACAYCRNEVEALRGIGAETIQD